MILDEALHLRPANQIIIIYYGKPYAFILIFEKSSKVKIIVIDY